MHARYRRRIAVLVTLVLSCPPFADAARKPLCTADERLCPLEYGSTRFICVERESVTNCGGCSANGSGQNCERIDAAAVGCSKDGDCVACFWARGGWEQQGFDDELVCEPAERQPFTPPPERHRPIKPLKPAAFVHQLSGHQTPNSPFFHAPLLSVNQRDPVGRIQAAAPWAAARRVPGAMQADAPRGDAAAAVPPAARVQKDVEGYTLDELDLWDDDELDDDFDVPVRPEKPRVAAELEQPADQRAGPRDDNHVFNVPAPPPRLDGAELLQDVLDPMKAGNQRPLIQPVPERHDGKIARDPRRQAADNVVDPDVLRSLPSWLRQKLSAEPRIFGSEIELFEWLRAAQDERAKDKGNKQAARKRTNAERFALDLPPLPPVDLQKKAKPGDEEKMKARERRMELEELRAMAELKAFREGTDPDEAIAAVRLPPPIDEKQEAEQYAALDKAINEVDLAILPDGLSRALRSLIQHHGNQHAFMRGPMGAQPDTNGPQLAHHEAAPPAFVAPPQVADSDQPDLFDDMDDEVSDAFVMQQQQQDNPNVVGGARRPAGLDPRLEALRDQRLSPANDRDNEDRSRDLSDPPRANWPAAAAGSDKGNAVDDDDTPSDDEPFRARVGARMAPQPVIRYDDDSANDRQQRLENPLDPRRAVRFVAHDQADVEVTAADAIKPGRMPMAHREKADEGEVAVAHVRPGGRADLQNVADAEEDAVKNQAPLRRPMVPKKPVAEANEAYVEGGIAEDEDAPRGGLRRPVIPKKKSNAKPQDAGGVKPGAPEMGAPFVKAMQDALGPVGWRNFMAALAREAASSSIDSSDAEERMPARRGSKGDKERRRPPAKAENRGPAQREVKFVKGGGKPAAAVRNGAGPQIDTHVDADQHGPKAPNLPREPARAEIRKAIKAQEALAYEADFIPQQQEGRRRVPQGPKAVDARDNTGGDVRARRNEPMIPARKDDDIDSDDFD